MENNDIVFRPFTAEQCLYNSKTIHFSDYDKTIVFSRKIFNGDCLEIKKSNKPFLQLKKHYNTSNTRNDSLKRTKEKIFTIADQTDFTHFITLTFSSEFIDRTNSIEILKKTQIYLKNRVQRNNLSYLFIPEYHSDCNSIHLHGLVKGDLKLQYSGYYSKNKRVIKCDEEIKGNHNIYNLSDWGLGFTTVIKLYGSKSNTAKYITKYITKDVKKIFGKFYIAGGKDLKRNAPCTYDNIDFYDYPQIPICVQPKKLYVKYSDYKKREVNG